MNASFPVSLHPNAKVVILCKCTTFHAFACNRSMYNASVKLNFICTSFKIWALNKRARSRASGNREITCIFDEIYKKTHMNFGKINNNQQIYRHIYSERTSDKYEIVFHFIILWIFIKLNACEKFRFPVKSNHIFFVNVIQISKVCMQEYIGCCKWKTWHTGEN